MARRRKNRDKKRACKNATKKSHAVMEDDGQAKASFKLEALEPRILLSATWVDADTGDAIAGATEGDDVYIGSNKANVVDGLGGDDVLQGGNDNDQLFGGAGNDQLFGGHQSDTLDGGTGDDQIFGGKQDDVLISGGGNDFMDGGKQDDVFRFDGAQDGNVITVVGGENNDTIDLSGYSNSQINDNGSSIAVDLGSGQSFTVNYSEVETIVTADGSYSPGGIPAGNSAPDAVDDSVSTNTDTPATTGNVLGNDTDPDGDTLSITGFTQASNGTVADNGDGTFTYTPNAGYNGNDSFTYTVDDGNGNTDTATVNVTVNAVDDAPTASAGADQTVSEGAGVTLDASGSSDPEGQSLTYTWTQTGGPSVTLSDTSASQPTFSAPEGTSNTSLTFQVSVSDGTTTSVDTITVTVNADDDAPTANAGADQTVSEGAGVTLDASGSSDPEGQSLTYTWTQTSGPNVTLSDTSASQPTFSAPEGTSNTSLTFQVSVSDGTTTSVDTITVTVNATEGAPTGSGGADQTPNAPPPSDPGLAPPVDEPSPVDSKESPDLEPIPSAPVSVVSGPADDGSVETRGADPTAETSPVTIQSPSVGVSEPASDPGSVETTASGERESEPHVASDDKRSAGSGESVWDGSEDMDVMDPSEGLTQDIEIDGVESTRISPREVFEQTDGIPPGAIDEEFEVVESVDLPSSQSIGNVVRTPFFGNESTGRAAPQVFVPSTEGQTDERELQDRVEDNSDTFAARQSDRSEEAQLVGARATSLSQLEESATDLKVEEGDPFLTSRGFFARLWGTVHGLVGTSSRTSGSDAPERTRRR